MNTQNKDSVSGVFLASKSKSKKTLIAVGCFVAYVGLVVFLNYRELRDFNAMTPAVHLETARSLLAEGRLYEALRHAQSITKGAVALQARVIEAEITEAREQTRLAEENRKAAISGLQTELKNRGYELIVSRSDKPKEITIASKDFSDTDHRVQFLSYLRGRNGPAGRACIAGFQNVRLKDTSLIAGFSEVYSLNCFN